MTITAKLVKELRDHTGAGIMACKSALKDSDGDVKLATELLRKKGVATAQKKSGRVAPEGLIGTIVSGNEGVVVEVNAETDFVARNSIFQDFVSEIAEIALHVNQEHILDAVMKSGRTVQQVLTENIAVIGENQSFRRSAKIAVERGVIGAYTHSVLRPNLGRIGALVGLEVKGDFSRSQVLGPLKNLGKNLAMHVASIKPRFVRHVPPTVLEKERDILICQSLNEGKPKSIADKIVAGRLHKFTKETVFEQQIFVMDGETKVADLVASVAATLNLDIKISKFIRYELGEGIEK